MQNYSKPLTSTASGRDHLLDLFTYDGCKLYHKSNGQELETFIATRKSSHSKRWPRVKYLAAIIDGVEYAYLDLIYSHQHSHIGIGRRAVQGSLLQHDTSVQNIHLENSTNDLDTYELLAMYDIDAANGDIKLKNTGKDVKARLRKGYLVFSCRGIERCSHRAVYVSAHGTVPEGMVIDHINGNKLDNRLDNLRAVTPRVNSHNTKYHRINSSGLRGVSWRKDTDKWRVRYHGKSYGSFACLIDAAAFIFKLENEYESYILDYSF